MNANASTIFAIAVSLAIIGLGLMVTGWFFLNRTPRASFIISNLGTILVAFGLALLIALWPFTLP